MNRNFIRYSRGGTLLQLQNQKHHYQVLHNPRKSMQIQDEVTLKVSLLSTSRQEKQLQKLRIIQNQRLVKALQTIRLGKGVMGQMTQKAKQSQKYKKSLDHTIQYLKSQKKKQLRNNNQRLVHKIGYAQPKIGNNEDWQKHFQYCEKQKQKISRSMHHFFDAQPLLNQTKHTLNVTLRKTFDFKTTKKINSNSKKNKSQRKNKRNKRTFYKEIKQENNVLNQQETEQSLIKKSDRIWEKKNQGKSERSQKNNTNESIKNIETFKSEFQQHI